MKADWPPTASVLEGDTSLGKNWALLFFIIRIWKWQGTETKTYKMLCSQLLDARQSTCAPAQSRNLPLAQTQLSALRVGHGEAITVSDVWVSPSTARTADILGQTFCKAEVF